MFVVSLLFFRLWPAAGGGSVAKPDVSFKEIGMPALSSTMTEGKVRDTMPAVISRYSW